MEPVSILSGSDNLFKYLFTVGAVMIVVSILYPLQKSQEIEIQQADLLKKSELLNNEIESLDEEYKKGEKEYKKISSTLDSLVSAQGNKVIKNKKFLELRERGNEIIQNLNDKERELAVKNIIIKNEKSKIDLLKKHSQSYKSYYVLISCLGLFFLLIGFLGWCFSTFIKEKTQWVNLKEKMPKKDNSEPDSNKSNAPPQKSKKNSENG